MKAYLLLIIVALSISNVASRDWGQCNTCSSSWWKFWKHCKTGMRCVDGRCQHKHRWIRCPKIMNETLASLGNENQEDYSSIDLL